MRLRGTLSLLFTQGLLAVTVLTGAAAAPAGAAPASDPVPLPAGAGPSGAQQVQGPVRSITLVTGDRVLAAAGSPLQVRYQPADPTRPGYETRTIGKDVYVVPDAAAEPVATGRADLALFNVSGLLRQGYDDEHTRGIPLIATYNATYTGSSRAAARPVPAGAVRTRSLAAADALVADKTTARMAWQSLAAGPARKIWLDAKVHSTLDQSVPYVRAPLAWQAGYDGTGTTVAVLDTGVDADHPDLAGTIDAEQNFTASPDVGDHDGHGTHTSSTVLGRGVASDGRNKGVAPGARLLVGKVLDDTGTGSLSEIIAGMEWAVAQGADVVSMSIGNSEPTDCADPMADALNRLSASSDTLFVVAAGNLGGPREMVTSPGCAAAALTVAATDLTATTASFSGRGPVIGTHAIKPDIAAPGVDITAARAGGRGDQAYVDMSGTSMATPHVAGAAAILKQRHPDWDGEQLKGALQSTVRGGSPVPIFEQGAGLLDVANAVEADVTGPGTTDLGAFAWPHTPDQTVTKPIVYRNSGDTARTLRFTVDARGDNGKPLPSSAFKLGVSQLTVPAGQTASLPATVVPSASIDFGLYGSVGIRIVATTDDGKTVVTPVGFYLEPKHVDVTLRMLDRNGAPVNNFYSSLDVFDIDAISAQRVTFAGNDRVLHLRAGTYSLAATVGTTDTAGKLVSLAFLGDPELQLSTDRTLTFDARTAEQSTVWTQRPSQLQYGSINYGRVIDRWVLSSSRVFNSTLQGLYLARTPKAERGTFEVIETWQYASPTTATKPYLYSLAFTHARQVTGSLRHRVRDNQLASIDATYHAPGKSYTYSEFTDVYRPWSLVLIGTGDRVLRPAPGRVEHLVTAERDTRVAQMVGHSDAMHWSFATFLRSTPTAYRPGTHRRESWFRAGLRPGIARDPLVSQPVAPAKRQGNTMWSNLAAWTDTEPGHYSFAGFLDLGGTELLADGVSLGKYGFRGQGVWNVPAAAANYELVYDMKRWQRAGYSWQTPSAAQTRWRFRSQGGADTVLPLLFPDYDLVVDGNDAAPRVRYYPIAVSVEAVPGYTAGRITSARGWASYDKGVTWSAVPVQIVAGHPVAIVDNTKAVADGTVSFKVELTDAHGVCVTQSLTDFYTVH